MGISIGFSSSSYDKVRYVDREVVKTKIVKVPTPPLPNPNPNRYKIIRYQEFDNYLLLEIKYLDCINYEGNKVMVYECSMDDLLKQGSIDPHFAENKDFHSPIARFEPTGKGWEMAHLFIFALLGDEILFKQCEMIDEYNKNKNK